MKWKKFEELTAQIYAELSPAASVVHNDKIQGIDSGVVRQIDVSIRFALAGHQILTVVQARDHAQPADINDIGEFSAVIKDIRANKGIVICKSGFTEGATRLARNLGIDICNIHDAKSRDWALEIELPVLWIDLLPSLQFAITMNVEGGDLISRNPSEWIISSDRGKTRIDPISTFVRVWNDGRIPRDVGMVHHLHDPNLREVEIAALNKIEQPVWRSVKEVRVDYTVSRRAWLGSFSPEECRGIMNYTNGTFTISYLPIGVIPKQRDARWREIEDPDKLVVSIPGTLITTEGWQINPNTTKFSGTELHELD